MLAVSPIANVHGDVHGDLRSGMRRVEPNQGGGAAGADLVGFQRGQLAIHSV